MSLLQKGTFLLPSQWSWKQYCALASVPWFPSDLLKASSRLCQSHPHGSLAWMKPFIKDSWNVPLHRRWRWWVLPHCFPAWLHRTWELYLSCSTCRKQKAKHVPTVAQWGFEIPGTKTLFLVSWSHALSVYISHPHFKSIPIIFPLVLAG